MGLYRKVQAQSKYSTVDHVVIIWWLWQFDI